MEFRGRTPSFYSDSGADDRHWEYGWSHPPSGNFLQPGHSLDDRRNRLEDSSGSFLLLHRIFTLGLAGPRDASLPWPDLDRRGDWGAQPPFIRIRERPACSSTAPATTLGNRRFSHQYNHGHSLFCRHALLLCLESPLSSEDGKRSCRGSDSGVVQLYLRFPRLGKVGTRGRSARIREGCCSKLIVPLARDHRFGPLSPLDPGISKVRRQAPGLSGARGLSEKPAERTDTKDQLLASGCKKVGPSISGLFQFCQHISSAVNLLLRLRTAWSKSQEITQFLRGTDPIASLL